MDPNGDRVIEYYDQCHKDYRLAWKTEQNLAIHYGFYDETARSFDQAAINSNRVLANALRVKPGDHVIDAGCGVGGTSIWLAQNVGCSMLAVNIQPMHIDIGRREVEARGLTDRVRFLEADFTRIDAPAASADAMFSLEGLSHGPDKQAFFNESARLLKPGGRLVLFEYFTKEEPLTAAQHRRLEKFKAGWAMPSLPRVSTYRQLAAQAGFSAVDWVDTTANVLPDSRRMMLLSSLALPRTFYRVWRGRRPAAVLGNRLSAWLQYRLFRQRTLHYGILTATL
ncbi:MAG: SAM-dependent methyltransferase [Novosphingobium sp.]